MTNAVKENPPTMNFVQAINQAIADAMEADSSVLVLGEDVADGQEGGIAGVTKGLSARWPDRVRSTPISEQAIMGAAIGASLVGFKPVAEIMLMNFTTVAMDMIVNHAAKLRFMSGGQTGVPLVVRTMTGAGFGSGGQHCDYLEAWFAHTAGLKVVAPSSPADAYGLMRSAIDDPDPVIFIENLPTYWANGPAPEHGSRIPLGQAQVLREGKDVTVVSYARIFGDCQAVAEELSAEGISVELIDLRTIAPWDRATVLASVRKTGRAVLVHEAVRPFGVGAEIAATIHEELHGWLKAPVRRIGSNFSATPAARNLEAAFLPSRKSIADAIRSTLSANYLI